MALVGLDGQRHHIRLIAIRDQLARGGATGNEVTLLPLCRDAFEMFFVTLFLYLAQGVEEALATTASSAGGPGGLQALASR